MRLCQTSQSEYPVKMTPVLVFDLDIILRLNPRGLIPASDWSQEYLNSPGAFSIPNGP